MIRRPIFNRLSCYFCTILVLLFGFNSYAFGAEEDHKGFWNRDTFTGNWGGLRSKLEEKGVTLEMVYTGEMVSVLSGGLQRKTVFLDNKDIVLSVDAETLLGWKGAEFSFYVLGNHGDSPSEYIGDFQTMSNIDTDATWKLYEAWYQQSFLGGKVSFKFGLIDLNSEFDVIEAGGLFHHSSFGIGVDFSQSGMNGPSIFSTTSLGFRVRVEPKEGFYVQTIVLDGVPGDPDNPKGTHIILKKEEGWLIVGEVGYESDKGGHYRKFAIGTWFYTADFETLSEVGEEHKNKGFYLLTELQLVGNKEGSIPCLNAFLRLGFADRSVNQLGFYLGAGFVVSHLIPGREDDQLGLAFAYGRNGNIFMNLAPGVFDWSETAIELVYSFQVTPWFALQPEIQFILNPGMEKSINDAFSFGVRSEISF
jgi:porin